MTICTSTEHQRRRIDPRMSRAAAALSVCGVIVWVIGGCATRGPTCPPPATPPAAGIPPAHVDPQPVALVTEDDKTLYALGKLLGRMRVGGKSRLVCPPETAYGDKGRPPSIPGGATLVFDLELISIEPPAAASEPAKPAQ